MLSFFWELASRAWASSVASMGTTTLAIFGALLYPLQRILVEKRHHGWNGVIQHWKESLKYSVLIAICWWAILFAYHLVYKVPHDISVQASKSFPPPMRWPKAIPSFAYEKAPPAHAAPKTTGPSKPIQIVPSYGNLKGRTIDLAQEIAQLVRHRYDQQAKYQQPLTLEAMREWHRSNDAEFRFNYLGKVKDIRDEFAELHIRDPRLDEILNRDDENIKERQSYPQIPPEAGWMHIFEIQQIGERLMLLANEVPQ